MSNDECRVYVSNLPADIRCKDLEDLFREKGKISKIDGKFDRPKPFAFVHFADARDAYDAVNDARSTDVFCKGRKLRVELYKSRDEPGGSVRVAAAPDQSRTAAGRGGRGRGGGGGGRGKSENRHFTGGVPVDGGVRSRDPAQGSIRAVSADPVNTYNREGPFGGGKKHGWAGPGSKMINQQQQQQLDDEIENILSTATPTPENSKTKGVGPGQGKLFFRISWVNRQLPQHLTPSCGESERRERIKRCLETNPKFLVNQNCVHLAHISQRMPTEQALLQDLVRILKQRGGASLLGGVHDALHADFKLRVPQVEHLEKFAIDSADMLEVKGGKLRMLGGQRVEEAELRQKMAATKQAIQMQSQRMMNRQLEEEYARDQSILQEMLMRNAAFRHIDVAFMVDCTGSMGPHIQEAKNKVKEVVDAITSRYNRKVRIAFVGYRDHCDGARRIEALDFVDQVDKFESFLAGIREGGGGDTCEDVFGGLEASIGLAWTGQHRCLVHIGDAPAHGGRFHSLSGFNSDDDISRIGADRRGLKIEDLIRDIKGKEISYFFGWINNSTKKMVITFNEIGGQGFCQASDMADVKKFVQFAVDSISRTIEMGGSHNDALESGKAGAIVQKKFTIVKAQPDWKYVQKLSVKIGSYQVSDGKNLPSTLKYRYATVQMAPHPFAQGTFRISYFGIEIGKADHFFSTFDFRSESEASVVLKTFKREYGSGRDDGRYDFLSIAESQAVSGFLATKFNGVKPEAAAEIRFLDVKFLEAEAPDGSSAYYTMEDKLPGYEFTKYSDNFGLEMLSDCTATLHAFSHWTYEHTNHYLVVVDLQGIHHEGRFVLTDPVIHSKETINRRFGKTDQGEVAMRACLQDHKCNNICRLMKLTSIN